jgi:hypothetical protein
MPEDSPQAPVPLSYHTPNQRPLLARLMADPAPAVLAPLSLLPVALFVIMLFTADRWSKFFQTGQAWERICGVTWICVASASLLWLIVYLPRPKRRLTWVCLALHAVFLGLTVCPGFVMLSWLMHWMSGPGS